MFEPQNLPFQLQNYLKEPQYLEQLRNSLQHVMQQDIDTLESLLSSVQATLSSQQIPDEQSEMRDVRRKERQGQLFLLMAQQNRERSEKISSLVQLMTHLLDFIEEEQQNNQEQQEQYQRTIDHLNTTIQQLRHSNKNVKSDVQIFRQHLERAQLEIDELVQKQGEEQEYNKGLLREGCLMKESKIIELEGELQELKARIKTSRVWNKDMFEERSKDKQLRYVFSQSRFFPINVLRDQYTRMTKELQNYRQPFQLQKQQNQQIKQEILQDETSELSKALQHVLSKRSIASTLKRQNSVMLRPDNSIANLQMTNLCYQLHKDQQEGFDILPRVPSVKMHSTLIYLDDQEELQRDCSRHIFDRLCQTENQTLPTPKNSDHQTSTSNRSFITLKNSPLRPCKTKSRFKEADNYDFSLKKNNSTIESPSQGSSFYSSMFNFVVNRRIKRASQKASSYCPFYKA